MPLWVLAFICCLAHSDFVIVEQSRWNFIYRHKAAIKLKNGCGQICYQKHLSLLNWNLTCVLPPYTQWSASWNYQLKLWLIWNEMAIILHNGLIGWVMFRQADPPLLSKWGEFKLLYELKFTDMGFCDALTFCLAPPPGCAVCPGLIVKTGDSQVNVLGCSFICLAHCDTQFQNSLT